MDEQMENQPQRVPVRRKQPKPTWERMLRKYFPTIRFVLICILLLLMVSLLVKAVVVGISALVSRNEESAAAYSYSEMMTEIRSEEFPYEFASNI